VNPNDIVGNSVDGFSLFPMGHPRGTLVAKFSRANGSHAALGRKSRVGSRWPKHLLPARQKFIAGIRASPDT
jgi:hypothetical protein